MPNPSNKRLRRAIYGQSPSADGSTITIENGAGEGKDLTIGAGSVFNLGGVNRFGSYPTNGMSMGFLRNLSKFNNGTTHDKCDTSNNRTVNVFSGNTLADSDEFALRITTDFVVISESNTFDLSTPMVLGATLPVGTTVQQIVSGNTITSTLRAELKNNDTKIVLTTDHLRKLENLNTTDNLTIDPTGVNVTVPASVLTKLTTADIRTKNTSGFVDGDICKAMGTGNCGTGIDLNCSNFGNINGINRMTLDGNHVVAIEIWQRDFNGSPMNRQLHVLVAGDHSTQGGTVAGKRLTIAVKNNSILSSRHHTITLTSGIANLVSPVPAGTLIRQTRTVGTTSVTVEGVLVEELSNGDTQMVVDTKSNESFVMGNAAASETLVIDPNGVNISLVSKPDRKRVTFALNNVIQIGASVTAGASVILQQTPASTGTTINGVLVEGDNGDATIVVDCDSSDSFDTSADLTLTGAVVGTSPGDTATANLLQ